MSYVSQQETHLGSFFGHKKIASLSSVDIGTIHNRGTTQLAQTFEIEPVCTAFGEISFAIPLGITQDTPECNSQPLYVSGSINP